MHHSTGSRRASALLGLTLALGACDGGSTGGTASGDAGGTLVIALQSEPRMLFPPLIQQVDEKIVSDQIFEPLAWLGDEAHLDRGYRPALAERWSWERDSTVVVFHLNPKARWQDGTPVRATDVRFTFDMYTDSVVGSKERRSLSNIDSVSVRDSATVAFWFNTRYVEQFYDAATRMLIVPEHLIGREPRATLLTSGFGRKPIGSGRFRFSKWATNATIELAADTTHYRERAKLDRVIFAVTTDPNVLSTRLSTGDLDAAEITNSAMYKTFAAKPQFNARILPAFDYTFLLFNARDRKNSARPNVLFGDVGLRRALSMALDRDRLVRSQFDSMASVAIGPMTRAQPLADTTVATIAYDSAGAIRMLDSLGWTLAAGKTVRERNGTPLAFSVIVPSVSRNRMSMIVRIQESLRLVGVDVKIDAMDPQAYVARLTARDFDVAFEGRHAEIGISGLGPFWSVANARRPGAPNFGGYQNAQFDAHFDSAVFAHDASAARPHAKQAFSIIVADAPAVWLYEARSAPLIHKRFRTAHITPGAWWAGIADWSIPPAERLPRDRMGLSVAGQ